MRRFGDRSRLLLASGGAAILLAYAALVAFGLSVPAKWTEGVYAGGTIAGEVQQPPFPPLSKVSVFDIGAQPRGSHFYVLGSDPGGRDILGLVAKGSLPSLLLAMLVVVCRLLLGTVAGLAAGLGSGPVRTVSLSISGWIAGFPYLALAVIVIQALDPRSRLLAFVVGMTLVGWRDIASLVAERVRYVRAQPFALAAKSLGTEGGRFFRLHVIPFLRPTLTVELAFQASAVLVLLAELGFLQVYLGGFIALQEQGRGAGSVTTGVLLKQPELGQLLASARNYILERQFGPVLVPTLAIALLAAGFEMIGTALRGNWRTAR